jgi:hypothetical protein
MFNAGPARFPKFLVPGNRLAMPKLRSADRLMTHIVRLRKDRKANVAIASALVMIPTVYLLGTAS